MAKAPPDAGFAGDDSPGGGRPEGDSLGAGPVASSSAENSSSGDGLSAGISHGDIDAVEALVLAGGDRLRERMTRIERHLEHVSAAAGEPLAAYAGATIRAGGKRLRPLLVVLAAESTAPAPDGDAEDECLVRAAAAVELVHSATLVHDDVIDRAELRRGRPTVVAAAGPEVAIATGDLLFSRAFAELAGNEDLAQLQVLSDASSALAAGELLQRADAYASHVTIERYLRRCELKTAALFEAACRLGALVAASGPADLAELLGAFARRIGLAFQILDDVLDVSGPVELTGKARGTDLLDGTVTLPLILAREYDAGLAGVDLAALREPDGPAAAEALCDWIAATGALERARAQALALVAEAKAMLPTSLAAGRPELLEQVADAVVARYR